MGYCQIIIMKNAFNQPPHIYFIFILTYYSYGKCPKISYTKVSDRMAFANSADTDQTAPEGAV